MKKRVDLPESQLFESVYAPVQTYTKSGKKQELYKIQFIYHEEKKLRKELHGYEGRITRFISYLWRHSFGLFGEEWIFLSLLGISIAIISYGIDKGAYICNSARFWLYNDLSEGNWSKYFAWISLPVCLCLFNAGFVKILGPKAAGSGIPEIKTILRGVKLPEFLNFKVFIAKIVGITATLGSGMPLGKEGPLIHISSCLVTLLGKLVNFQGIYRNESRKVEMLAAACAVGVACTFAAPIGGVLLSVEITTAYFAVRNYWRGFCAAVWGATVYRLLLVWIEGAETVTGVFETNFFVVTPFAAHELLAFAVLGIICGLGAAFYMQMQIKYKKFLASNKFMSEMRKRNVFLYPGLIAWIVATISYPAGIGQYLGGHIPAAKQVTDLFSNFTWTSNNLTVMEYDIVQNWHTKHTGIYLHLLGLIAFDFICSILATNMPIPNGCFSPSFRIGASIGRILGELMHTWYPTGLSYHGRITPIIPGGYSIVGAAAFVGAVTQTMSICLIVVEMTRQFGHVLPLLVAVLIANGIAQLMGPSIYNSVIKAKKLPYLPDLLPNNSVYYDFFVEDFMIPNPKFLYTGMSLEQLKNVLKNNKLQSFPLVNDPINKVLLGSIQRLQLITILEQYLGHKRRLEYITESEEEQIISVSEQDSTTPTIEDSSGQQKIIKLPKKRICDLEVDQQKLWEQAQMKTTLDFSSIRTDPAPFQLVEKTSLLKVHTLFSMVGINIAYVTAMGKLIGMVTLDGLRKIIEDVSNGNLQPHTVNITVSGPVEGDSDGAKGAAKC